MPTGLAAICTPSLRLLETSLLILSVHNPPPPSPWLPKLGLWVRWRSHHTEAATSPVAATPAAAARAAAHPSSAPPNTNKGHNLKWRIGIVGTELRDEGHTEVANMGGGGFGSAAEVDVDGGGSCQETGQGTAHGQMRIYDAVSGTLYKTSPAMTNVTASNFAIHYWSPSADEEPGIACSGSGGGGGGLRCTTLQLADASGFAGMCFTLVLKPSARSKPLSLDGGYTELVPITHIITNSGGYVTGTGAVWDFGDSDDVLMLFEPARSVVHFRCAQPGGGASSSPDITTKMTLQQLMSSAEGVEAAKSLVFSAGPGGVCFVNWAGSGAVIEPWEVSLHDLMYAESGEALQEWRAAVAKRCKGRWWHRWW